MLWVCNLIAAPASPYLVSFHQVISCDPLRVFIFKEGLARICTELYTAPKVRRSSCSQTAVWTVVTQCWL